MTGCQNIEPVASVSDSYSLISDEKSCRALWRLLSYLWVKFCTVLEPSRYISPFYHAARLPGHKPTTSFTVLVDPSSLSQLPLHDSRCLTRQALAKTIITLLGSLEPHWEQSSHLLSQLMTAGCLSYTVVTLNSRINGFSENKAPQLRLTFFRPPILAAFAVCQH